ncbi:YceI family protein [Mesorhizobium sp. ORM8.1]
MFEVVALSRKTRARAAPWRIGLIVAAILGLLVFGSRSASAAPNWTLDPDASVLTYQSVKKNTIVETNKIRNITGTLSSAGDAKISFDLNSVDTGVDLRNVRMRFLFFETFKFPTAELTAKVDPAAFADLPTKRRIKTILPFRLSMHGVDKDLEASVVVTMISDTQVSVASRLPSRCMSRTSACCRMSTSCSRPPM